MLLAHDDIVKLDLYECDTLMVLKIFFRAGIFVRPVKLIVQFGRANFLNSDSDTLPGLEPL